MAIIAQFGNLWRFCYPVCGERVGGFSPFPDYCFEQLAEHGSDLRITEFAACNGRSNDNSWRMVISRFAELGWIGSVVAQAGILNRYPSQRKTQGAIATARDT